MAEAKTSAWRAWFPALIWLGIIAVESTGAFSAQNTGRFLYPLLHFLFSLDPMRFVTWHFFLRKSGHVIGYGILSILLFRAWRATIPVTGNPRWAWGWSLDAVLMTTLVASLDEWHQFFLPSRTGTVRDVVLDSAAGVAAQVVVFLVCRGWKAPALSQSTSLQEDSSPENPTPVVRD
jgi:VanZ family protein